MQRLRRPGALLFIAIVALSALVPGAGAFAGALLEPEWVLLPDLVVVAPAPAAAAGSELTLSLRSLLPSRAPPFAI